MLRFKCLKHFWVWNEDSVFISRCSRLNRHYATATAMVGRAGHRGAGTRGTSSSVFHGRSDGSRRDMRVAAPGILLAAGPQGVERMASSVRNATGGEGYGGVG